MPRRIVVVGAGAIGGVIATGLLEHGRRVAVVARGDHLHAMERNGLRRISPDGAENFRIAAFPTVAAAQVTDDDIVIVATKTPQAPGVLDELFVTAGPRLAVACATNGIETERLALRRFDTVLGILVNVPALHLTPGQVEVYATEPRGLLDVGDYPNGRGHVATELAEALAGSGFLSDATPTIMDLKWAKLLGNVGNVLQVLCGPESDDWEDLYELVRAEAEAVAAAAGVTVDLGTQQDRAAMVAREDIADRTRLGGSTWQSAIRRTGSLETVALNGEIALQGRLFGVPTPANALVHLEAERLLRDGREIGSVRAVELLARLAGAH